MLPTKAKWTKDGEVITGSWKYNRSRDQFSISLDAKCVFSGQSIRFETNNDSPDFNGWSRVKVTKKLDQGKGDSSE